MKSFYQQLLCVTFVAAAAAMLSQFVSPEWSVYLSVVLILAIFVSSQDLLFGVTGMLSFGQAAFYGLAGYVYGILTVNAIVSPWGALAIAAGSAGLLGLMFGLVTLRVNGLYLGLTTLALAQLVQVVLEVKLQWLTGGTDGLAGVPRPEVPGVDIYRESSFTVLVAVLFCAAMLSIVLLRESQFGQVLRAIRQNEMRVKQLGYDARRYKVAIFGISGVFAGLAGALLACLITFVGPDTSRWTTSGEAVIMNILGGRGFLFGPLLGAAAFQGLKQTLSSITPHWYGLLGIVFIVITLAAPSGIAGALRRLIGKGRL